MTQIYIKQNIHKHQKQNFRRISPFGITPVEKAHNARTRWYRGPLRRFINTRFKKRRDDLAQHDWPQMSSIQLYVHAREHTLSYTIVEGDRNETST